MLIRNDFLEDINSYKSTAMFSNNDSNNLNLIFQEFGKLC